MSACFGYELWLRVRIMVKGMSYGSGYELWLYELWLWV